MNGDDDASAPGRLGLDLRLVTGRISRVLRRHYVQQGGDGEPGFLQLAVLSRLERAGPDSPGRLAGAERVTAQAVAIAVRDLEAARLITRTADPGDGRRVLLAISDAGRAALAGREDAIVQRLVKVVTDDLTAAERETLAGAIPLLDRLANAL